MDLVRNQEYFDKSFRENPNHWDYDKVPFRIRKHLRTWALISDLKANRILDLGCAAGVFTRYLRQLAPSVDACDISEVVIKNNIESNNDPGIVYFHFNLAENFKNVSAREYNLCVITEVINYMDKKVIVELLHHFANEANNSHVQILLSARISNGDKTEYGDNEFTYYEIQPILQSLFSIKDIAAIRLREKTGQSAATSLQKIDQLGLSDLANNISYLHQEKHLDEATAALKMGAYFDDVELIGWLLGGKHVST